MNAPINQQQMRAAAGRTAAVLKSLANETRLLLLCHLSQGEASVSEIEAALGIGQPTLSQQLGVLRRENLVSTRREGKQIFYRISAPDILTLLNTLYELYCPKNTGEVTEYDD
ncbi:ArsR/SmtB family transcription factor [[Enterobacter] lignolyticus]|uniref:Transcriptional regulator, ArsR family n=1 Tax=Enterobacter lignolyticus (strain SCF1) TaxID=701347 RepID=E3G5F5_ENTLS|nr:metalloregulator ArsR/SmtB family transcription factor [[Enterobacter] lignolyticus]ADO49480.1 transcriptional regulator, ArsR family [[Enterobacter] lignolyticus SCF1]